MAIRTTGTLFLLAALALPTSAQAQAAGTTPGRVWTFDTETLPAPAAPFFVGFGQHGTQVYVHVSGYYQGALLLSRHDADPPAPIWQLEIPVDPFGLSQAAEADLFADVSGLGQVLRVFRSGGLAWTYVPASAPCFGQATSPVQVSADGQRIVIALDDKVLHFGPDSPVPQQVVPLEDSPSCYAVATFSGDCSRFAYRLDSTYMRISIVDTETGLNLFGFTGLTYSMKLSEDGRWFAVFLDDTLRLFHDTGAGYIDAGAYPLVAEQADGLAAFSRDGSTLAFASSTFNPAGTDDQVRITCVDLASLKPTLDVIQKSQGILGDHIKGLAIADDGSSFVVGRSGTGVPSLPTVQVWPRAGDAPLYELDTPGSVLDLDMSPDGRWVVVGSRLGHDEQQIYAGQVDLVHLGGSQIAMLGAPSLGHKVEFSIFGTPGHLAALLHAATASGSPATLPAGTLYLDPSDLGLVLLGRPIGADGTAKVTFTLPSDPALIGLTRCLQGLRLSPASLSADWLPLTLLP